MSPDIDTLWQGYLAAETDRIRPVLMAALDHFIDALLRQPESEWHAWARQTAAVVSDQATDIPIRMPLFQKVLLPALTRGVLTKAPGCARWLATHESLLQHSDVSALPEHLRTGHGLLLEAVRVDPSDTIARTRLVQREASHLEYTLHELPAGVLYGSDGATPEQCDELAESLVEFRDHVRLLSLQERYGDLLAECEFHYRAYGEYLRAGRPNDSYEAFLAARRRITTSCS